MLCARFLQQESGKHGRVYRAIESVFDAMLSGYRHTLDIALRHQAAMLAVFFATMALTIVMAVQIPTGFFPPQDIGLIGGVAETSQGASSEEMHRHMQTGKA